MGEERIVIGYDGSPDAGQAARWGMAEAQRTHSSVELVFARTGPGYLPAAAMIPGTPLWPGLESERWADEMLAAAVDQARTQFPGVPVRGLTEPGAPTVVLSDHSANARMVIVGGRSHGAWTGFLIGSVAGSLAAHARCTVVVVRGPEEPVSGAPIVLALDESSHSGKAAAFAFDQAAGHGSVLRVVRAWTPPADPWTGSAAMDREEVEVAMAQLDAVHEQVKRWQDKFPAVPVRVDVVSGHPRRVVTEAAADARMVVLGARGGGGFSGLRLGSVVRHVLHHAPVTVAVVR